MSFEPQRLPRLVVYVRTSTDDKQSPEDSKGWQVSVAQGLTVGRAEIVDVVHDIDVSRSKQWNERPEASRLLKAMANPERGWDGIIIGEPQRAFGDSLQYQVVAGAMEHFGIQLWVPEVGGPVDFDQEAHEMILGIFGTVSKGERSRLRKRVTAGMRAMAMGGRFMGGRPPYGYRLVSTGIPHPNPEKARYGVELQLLAIDPETSVVAEQIFQWAADGIGHREIARRLNANGTPCPSRSDPGRNTHRRQDRWIVSTITTMLHNPRYMGTERWGRKTKTELLVDPLDPLSGHKTHRTDADVAQVVEVAATIPPIVDIEVWQAAQRESPSGRGVQRPVVTGITKRRVYPYRGIVMCAHCGKTMHGDSRKSRHGQRLPPRYVCRGRDVADDVDHPTKLCFSERRLDGLIMPWLEGLFDEAAVRGLVAEMVAEANNGDPAREYLERLDRELGETNRKIERTYELMEDPDYPTSRAKERLHKLRQELTIIEAKRSKARERATPELDEGELFDWLTGLGGIVGLLADAEPSERRKLLLDLGLRVEIERRGERSARVVASLNPGCGATDGVGGGT